MNIEYPCLIEQDADDSAFWNATLDVGGEKDVWVVSAPTEEQALISARKLVDFYIRDCWKQGKEPDSGRAARPDWKTVTPSLPVQAALILRQKRKSMKLTQAELANKVGVTQQVYARLESPEKSNATLSNLERVTQALGVCMTLREQP